MNNPVWLKVVCIGCIVLGSLGLLTGLAGVAGQVFSASMQSSIDKFLNAMQQGAPNPAFDVQKKMQAEIVAVQHRWLVTNLILLGVQLFVAAGLLQESLKWVSGGNEFRVNESKCVAIGDSVCEFIVQKEPIS